jgi:hypothetical protein
VLNAILESSPVRAAGGPSKAEVSIDGKPAATLDLPSSSEISAPVRADLSALLGPGVHRVTIRRQGDASDAQVQLAASYYVPWPKAAPAKSPLRLNVAFDRLRGTTGRPITCRVHAERVGFHGYGMLLAEIGMPPGADVDRASLDRAMEASDWSLSHYDILPDRILVYLWPRAGGIDFAFRFRPRLAMRAKAAPSILYDYYNPEALTTQAPPAFIIERRLN